WTPDEDALLRAAVARHGTSGKWAMISSCIPGRTPIQCSTRWSGALNPRIHKGKWSKEEDDVLKASYREAIERLSADGNGPQQVNWQRIAERIPGRTAVQCIARYQEALDPVIRKGKWSLEEDAMLRRGLSLHGKSWVKIAEEIHGRTQRQCRTRWLQLRSRLEAEEAAKGGKAKREEEEEEEEDEMED
ncbi:Myb-like DNA-binding domain protein, partial [Irineochytrium annulatum]